MNKISSTITNLFLLISMAGIIDSAYLTITHLQGGEIGCFIVSGCDQVLKSSYSEIFNIPTAAFGLLFYLTIFILVFIYSYNGKWIFIKLASLLTFAGFIATLWFVYLQTFVIKAFCSYCLISAISSTILLILGVIVLRKNLPSSEV